MQGQNATAHYHLLKEQQAEIENEFGEPLDWQESTRGESSLISLFKGGTDPADETDWQNQHEWLASKLELFDKFSVPVSKHSTPMTGTPLKMRMKHKRGQGGAAASLGGIP